MKKCAVLYLFLIKIKVSDYHVIYHFNLVWMLIHTIVIMFFIVFPLQPHACPFGLFNSENIQLFNKMCCLYLVQLTCCHRW